MNVDNKTEYQLHQELELHKGYITSICFNTKSTIFSADSLGLITEWQKEKSDWVLKRFNSVQLLHCESSFWYNYF